MKKYDVFVQGKFYRSFEMEYINDILTQVNQDIDNNLVSDFDPNLPPTIVIQPG
jgi:hypothetical protein